MLSMSTTRGLPFDPRQAHELRRRIARHASLDSIIDAGIREEEGRRRAAEGRKARKDARRKSSPRQFKRELREHTSPKNRKRTTIIG